MAGRLSPRYPLLRCANPLEPSFRVTPFSTQSIAASVRRTLSSYSLALPPRTDPMGSALES